MHRPEADRDQHLDRVLAERCVAAAHRSAWHAGRGAAGECARLPAGGHATWRQGGHAARQRTLRQSAQLARSDAGDPRPAGGAGRVGGDGSRAARQPVAADCRWLAGRRGSRCAAAGARPDAAACGERRGTAGGLDAAAGAVADLARSGAAGGSRTATSARASACPTSRCRAARSPAGTCTPRRIPRARSPIVTARSWRSLKHPRRERRQAIRARRCPSAMRIPQLTPLSCTIARRRCNASVYCWRKMQSTTCGPPRTDRHAS